MLNKEILKVLFIGDIVGRPGREAVKQFLPALKSKENIDFVIANGENLAAGKGITHEKYQEMLDAGVDYLTSGNHVWNNRDIIPYMKDCSVKILRPANYPDDPPGLGYANVDLGGIKITLINLMGRVFIPGLFNDPFSRAKEIVEENPDTIKIIDFHAEATSEKIALAYFMDGKVSAVIGTHTHVQTADERILPGGTAFISDAGMCGPFDSVLGVEKNIIIQGFLTGLPQSHKVAVGDSLFNACLIQIDTKTNKALSIKRISKLYKK
jgi:metallophosphoesterase (TIGR00282 family)